MGKIDCYLNKLMKKSQLMKASTKRFVAVAIAGCISITGVFLPVFAGDDYGKYTNYNHIEIKKNQYGGGTSNIQLKAKTNTPSVSLSLSFEGDNTSIVAKMSPAMPEDAVSYSWKVDDVFEDEAMSGNTFYPDDEDCEHWVEVTAHLGNAEYTDRLYYSNLPVMYINTDGNAVIDSKTEYKSGKMILQGNTKFNKEDILYDGKVDIKGRGNSSWNNPKKPYKIKLDIKSDLLGLEGGKGNKHWVLLANYNDVAQNRYKLASEIAKVLGVSYMNSEWVDLVINGEYAGLYQLTQQVKVGKNRVNIYDWEDEADSLAKKIDKNDDALKEYLEQHLGWITERSFSYNGKLYDVDKYRKPSETANDDITGGYLFELDHNFDEATKFHTNKGLRVLLKSPEYLCTNEEMLAYVMDYWNEYENSYQAIDGYNEHGKSYIDYADIDSMVGFYLVNEISGNWDARSGSRYASKNQKSKLTFGPIWDFDVAFNSNERGWVVSKGDNGAGKQKLNFFREWLDDPYFCLKTYEKYWNNRTNIAQILETGSGIDQWREYLRYAGRNDDFRWPRSRFFENDVKTVKNYLKNRLSWMDSQFVSLDKYINSVRTTESTTPYTKADVQMSVVSGNLVRRLDTADYWATDYLLEDDTDADIVIAVKDSNTETISAYLNGEKLENYQKVPVLNGKCNIVVSANNLNLKPDERTMISIVGWDNAGSYTYTNYLTVSPLNEEAIVVKYVDVSGNTIGTQRYLKGEHVWNQERLLNKEGHTYKLYKDQKMKNEFVADEINLSEDTTVYVEYYVEECAHNLVKTEKKLPTCTENGNVEYYTCSKCGRIFTDASCNKEINLSDTVLSALGHDFEEIVVEPTKEAEGYTLHKCKRCGFTYEDNYKERLVDNSNENQDTDSVRDENQPPKEDNDNIEEKPESKDESKDSKEETPEDKSEDSKEEIPKEDSEDRKIDEDKELTDDDNQESKNQTNLISHYSAEDNCDKIQVGGKTDIKRIFDVPIDKKYRFYSSNKKIATVSKKGIVKGKKSGNVIITMKIKEGDEWKEKESHEVSIKKPVMKSTETVIVGNTIKASEAIIESEYLPTSWKSSNPKVLKVDAYSGEIEALKPGSAKIYAVFGNGKTSTKNKYYTKYIVSRT